MLSVIVKLEIKELRANSRLWLIGNEMCELLQFMIKICVGYNRRIGLWKKIHGVWANSRLGFKRKNVGVKLDRK